MLISQRVAIQRSLQNQHGRSCQHALRRVVQPSTERDTFANILKRLGQRRISQAAVNTAETTGESRAAAMTTIEERQMARALAILQRAVNPKKYEVWSNVARKLNETESSRRRRRIAVLAIDDMTQARDRFIEAIVGDVLSNEEVRDAIQGRWAALPISTSRLIIRHGDKVARFGPILEIPSKTLESLDAEIVEIRDAHHAPELLRVELPVIITSKQHLSVPSYLQTTLKSLIMEGKTDGTLVISDQGASSVPVVPGSTGDLINLLKGNLPISTKERSEKQKVAIRSMLDECSATLETSRKELDLVKAQMARLKIKVDGLLGHLRIQYETIDVPRELKENKRSLEESFERFNWYKIWDLDDLGERLSWTVTMGYGVEIERKLEWYAGLMGATQQRITELANEILEQMPGVLPAATLTNRIQQLEATSLPIPASSFTTAVVNRRRQLADTATQYLQTRFLRRVYASMLAMPVAVGTPALSWANQLVDLSFAAPTGVIALLLCIRHISKGWEKGRRKWWADYHRIELGLEDDIRLAVRDMLEARVMLLPQTLIEESALLVSQQEATIRRLADEVSALEETGKK